MMKRLSVLFVALGLLLGCQRAAVPEATVPPEDTAVPVVTAAAETPAPQGNRLLPLPATLHPDSVNDCSFAAGFAASDVYLNDDGALVVHMTVYDTPLFDLADVSRLALGDALVLEGTDVPVRALARTPEGLVRINGGAENGGCTLATQENGVYYPVDEGGQTLYRALGETTQRVGQDFILADCMDPSQPEKISYAGDFLMDMAVSDRLFSPETTTVTVEDGFITGIVVANLP